jgi:DNA-binding LacI/PurR family transcriptional regulator
VRHVLYIVEEEEVIRHEAFEVLLMLATRLHPKGLRISSLSMNFGHSEYRPQQWKRAIEGYAPDKVIVWSGRAKVAEWLQKSGMPSLFIGGDSGHTPIPIYGTLSRQAVGHILESFFERGHERIWFPFCNRSDAYTKVLVSYVANAFESRGLAFSQRWNTPVSPYRRPEVIVAMFEEAWRNLRPTALMFHDWREYLAVSSVLRREGLDIPRDMSVALIGDDPEMSWHRPELAHFVRPLKRIANACAAWVISEKPRHAVKSVVFNPEWQPGASIAAPRLEVRSE